MKKDLALALFVFCLTLVVSFGMDHDGKNKDIEKREYPASETARQDFVLAPEKRFSRGFKSRLREFLP